MYSTSNRRVQMVDREELYLSLPARIQYLHSFLDFSRRDIDALEAGQKYINALIPAVVNIVYKKLLQYSVTAEVFIERNTFYGGSAGELPDEKSAQIEYRKLFLRGYLQKICSDPSRMEYWEYLDRVGMMHVGLNSERPLHVEYVHMGASLGIIQDVLTEAILSHPRLKLERKIPLVSAINKVIWIQNDLFARWHVRDGDDCVDLEAQLNQERERYYGISASPAEGQSDSPPAPTCPFATVVGSGSGPNGASAAPAGAAAAGTCPVTGASPAASGPRLASPAAAAAAAHPPKDGVNGTGLNMRELSDALESK